MTEEDSRITTEELHALADGRLDPARRAEVAAYLETDPEAAAQVAAYRRQNAALHAAYDPVLDEPLPELLPGAPARRQSTPRRAAAWRSLAAGLAGLTIGGVAGWLAHDAVRQDEALYAELAERTAAAYVVYAPEVRHPVEVTAAEEEHLAAWLSNRLDMKFRVPRLGDLGFDLVGGRLMVGETGPAALLMYENQGGRRLVLYLRRDMHEDESYGLQFVRKDGVSVLCWIEGITGVGVSGELSETELSAAAHLIRAQLAI
ncbi:MAG: anti-sigma factor [Rhodospirillales bacterium]|nr:anti-sigma factor [Rhodospirillales bacterium]